MAFHPSTPSSLTQSKRASSGHGSSQNSSLLLEKAKAHIRRSTPDSEALASSDDEQEQHQRLAQAANPQMQRPNRRASWLSETHGSGRRKSSLSGGDGLTPSASYGTSGNPDGGPWNPAVAGTGRASTASNPFGWGSTIWSDSVKGPPARLAEVLPSPNPHDFSMSTDEPLNSPSLRRDSATDASIPFAIPLHPTLKTYRSQSYSVGQLDQEWANSGPRHSQMGHPARTRAGSSYAGLQHRLSRPSMLSEFSPDTSVLEQLREVDDDDEASTASSEAGVRLPSNNPRTIEQLAMENAILRQQAYANSVHVPTGATGLSGHYPAQPSFLNHTGGRQGQVNESVLEEPDDISVAADDGATGPAPGQYADADPPRYQHISHVGSPSPLYIENRALENVKKGHWQSSLGFGGVADVPQSRRHSFADIPLRGNAVSEAGKSAQGEYRGGAYGEGPPRQSHGENTSYFSNPLSRPADSYRPSSSSSSIHQGYTGVQQAHTTSSIRPLSQPSDQLYLVTFKAARAEFYYVQEGTGLEVNAGDLVIVEADRGTDLGTVAHRNVDWASAKQLKERYVTEHYNWLMMFSRQGQGGRPSSSNSPATISGANRPSGSSLPSAAHLGLNGSSDATGIEIKPKMIKRLAQPHEIHMLREKEGNEAKAKRMCQQKVSEHHLNMEILDAEFQMDWKKLTFYYYAEAYVNFNSLVTDLFKIYKTRIWMSAINPASFVSPLPNLQAQIPSATQLDRDRYTDHRHKTDGRAFVAASFHEPAPDNFDMAWTDGRAHSLAPSLAQTAYAHYFQNPVHGLPSPGHPVETLGRGLRSTFGSSSPLAFQQYSTPLAYRDVGHVNAQYRDDMDKRPYSEQLSSFQGLSLGPQT